MTRQEFEQWLADHHYPQLVLSEDDVIRHREWHTLLLSTSTRLDQALERIEGFLSRVEREKVKV